MVLFDLDFGVCEETLRCFPSAPGFSEAAAMRPGRTVALIFVGRLLINFWRNGGILSYISRRSLSLFVNRFSRSSYAVGTPLMQSFRIWTNSCMSSLDLSEKLKALLLTAARFSLSRTWPRS